MNRVEYSIDLDDAAIEVLFTNTEVPEPYHTNNGIKAAIKRRVRAKLLKIEERKGDRYETQTV